MDNTTDTANMEEEDHVSKVKHLLNIFSAVIFSLAFLLGTIGNGLVIWYITMQMKKTVNTVWFLNLAIADFVFTLFLPVTVAQIALDSQWPFGQFMCKFISSINNLNLFVSVFLLTVISMDRYISIVYPVWCKNHRRPRLASTVVLVVWLLGFVFTSPYFIFRDVHDNNYTNKIYCVYKFSNDGWNSQTAQTRHKAMVMTKFLISFVVPFTVIVSCYAVIALCIRRNQLTTSSKPFKIIVVVIVSFFVCWFPFHVFSVLDLSLMHYHGNSYLRNVIFAGFPLVNSLAFLNSCVNPFLYIFMTRDFKENVWRSIHSVLEKAFMEQPDQPYVSRKTILASQDV